MGCDARDTRVWSYHRGCDVTPVIEIHHRVISLPITPTPSTLIKPTQNKIPKAINQGDFY